MLFMEYQGIFRTTWKETRVDFTFLIALNVYNKIIFLVANPSRAYYDSDQMKLRTQMEFSTLFSKIRKINHLNLQKCCKLKVNKSTEFTI